MKFIRKEFIVTTIFDKELTDKSDILTVLNNLMNERIDFSMTIKKYMAHQQDFFNMSFEKVRVRKIHDNESVDLLAFKNGVKTSMKNLDIDHIVSIEAVTKKHKILDVVSDLDRFDLLDL